MPTPRRIENWLPVNAVSIEAICERASAIPNFCALMGTHPGVDAGQRRPDRAKVAGETLKVAYSIPPPSPTTSPPTSASGSATTWPSPAPLC